MAASMSEAGVATRTQRAVAIESAMAASKVSFIGFDGPDFRSADDIVRQSTTEVNEIF